MPSLVRKIIASFAAVVPAIGIPLIASTSTGFGQDATELVVAPEFTVASRLVPRLESKSVDVRVEQEVRGRILLCGGGVLPQQIREVFHEEGRGRNGRLVLIPTASALSDLGDFTHWIDYWSGFQWQSIEILHARDRNAAMHDSQSVESLRNASAVWISGGDQSRLAERYAGTPIESALLSVVSRGGIVGGTSAGAAIASSLMIAGGWAEPKISHGFPMLPKAIVDQHFSQKKRFQRLAKAVQSHPDRTGIGIDEGTGVLIGGRKAKIVGDGSVYVYRTQRLKPNEQLISTASFLPEALASIETSKLLPGDEIDLRDLDLFGE
ncbi:cyanophycinase [Pirellulaceae bacterium SH467]